MVYTELYSVYTGIYWYELSILKSKKIVKSAHDFFSLDSRSRWRVMGQACMNIQTFENHSKMWQNWVSMKSPIPQCTQHNSVYLGMKSSYYDIPSISQYEDFILRYTELSRWSGFQMQFTVQVVAMWLVTISDASNFLFNINSEFLYRFGLYLVLFEGFSKSSAI